jgi:hypothetical protein
MKLAQPTSAGGSPGKFYSVDTEEEYDDLRIVPVKVQAIRTLWPEAGFSRDRLPECASLDGVRAVERFSDDTVPLFSGRACVECLFYVSKPWLAAPGTRVCSPGYDIYGLSLDSYEVVTLRLHGTSTRVARVLARPGVFGLQVVRLYSRRQTSDRGSWYQMFGQPVGEITPEQAQEVLEIMAEFRPAPFEVE